MVPAPLLHPPAGPQRRQPGRSATRSPRSSGYWLQQGLAGFRVDAVPFLIEPTGTPDGAIPDPHELLREVRRSMGRRTGTSILMGEVNLPPEQQREFFGDEDGDELHMVLNFTVNQALYLSLARGSAEPLARALRELPEIPDDSPVGELRPQPRRADARQAHRRRAGGGVRRLRARAGASALRARAATPAAVDARRRPGSHPAGVLARVLAAGHAGPVLRRGDRDAREPRHPRPDERALADAVVLRAAPRVHDRASRRGRSRRATPRSRPSGATPTRCSRGSSA